MDKSKVFYDFIDGYDYPKGEAEPVFERYELQRDQEDFLYKLLNLWDGKEDTIYLDYCKSIQKIIDKGWYDEEEQFEIKDAIQIYKDDLER